MKRLLLGFVFLLSFLIPQGFAAASSPPSQLIIINTATNKLAFYENGNLVKEFPVATGKSSSPTPDGKFVIVNKITNRPYYTGHIQGGDPSNPLGDRWMGMDIYGTPGNTYAIHGNNNESTIGNWITGGCVRMHNADIHWLYDRINVKTTVIIKRAQTSYQAIASSYSITLDSSSPVHSTPASSSSTGRTTTALNVRTAPNISATRITTLQPGTTITIYETSNGWYRMSAGNISGWVSSQYVTSSSSQPASNTKIGRTTTALNVRTAPSISATRITTLQPGTTITIYETNNGWYRMSAGGISGWVFSQYVK
ncbi:SH3 domain-containing protein [Ectobacillus panaciterrae]|uniref:SH3 domain-containing protein n=1 Tax=Ectobacillus panaciterrae TaxID=363872 RepID=UPI000427BDA3|nr:SH3 domain-containing protein [Ectobacillus panaciterrae]